jgi:hypothetical protein
MIHEKANEKENKSAPNNIFIQLPRTIGVFAYFASEKGILITEFNNSF